LAAEGAIAAPVNSNLPDDGVDRYARRIAALGCLVENDAADCEPGTLTWRSSKTGEAATVVAAALRGAGGEPAYAHRPEDIVLLCHTSGTTGDPKAVSCSHHGFMVGILDQEDGRKCPLFGVSMLNALPPGHHSWLKTIVWALVSGTKLILANDQSARTLLDDVERFEPDSIRSFSCTLREVARLDLPPGSLRSVGFWMTTGDASPSRDIAAVAALGTRPVAGPDGVTRVPGMLVLDG